MKLARNLLILLDDDELPAHFLVGDTLHAMIEQRDAAYDADLERWKHLGVGVSLDD